MALPKTFATGSTAVALAGAGGDGVINGGGTGLFRGDAGLAAEVSGESSLSLAVRLRDRLDEAAVSRFGSASRVSV